MNITKIFNKKTGEAMFRFSDKDIVSVDPIKYYGDFFIVKQMILRGVPDDELNGKTAPSEKSKEIFIESTKLWLEKLNQIRSVEIPEDLIKLLSTTKKADQEKLLKDIELTPDLIAAFIFEACENHGYKFSQYKNEIPQKGLDISKLPLAYEVKEDGEVKIAGSTELSDGQLKQAMEHKKVTIGKFLEKDDDWHCFFTNYKSLRGEESWLGKNQPHFHYISSGFGLSKEQVIKELKSKKYKLKNMHVTLKEYGNQPE